MKQNKWKSNEANDKSLTGAKSSVEKQNKNSGRKKNKIQPRLEFSCEYLLADYKSVISYHCIFMASDVNIKKYTAVFSHFLLSNHS